jgi:esterase/lipase superfamily enzyme
MKVDHHKAWSPNLDQEMELNVYGEAGKPVLVFPTRGGRYYDYEGFGMVEACRPFIDKGGIRLFAVDSVDFQSWLNEGIHPADRARRHNQYDRYIVDEVVPFIRERCGDDGILVHGCSLGAYHSVNFYLRHPDFFDSAIALSGPYHARYCVGDYMDENVYYNSPLAYLPNLTDPWYLDRYLRGRIVVCVGQGAWEETFLADTRELKRIFEEKQIPAWVDIWGHDVAHDWPWWKIMMPYFLKELGLCKKGF